MASATVLEPQMTAEDDEAWEKVLRNLREQPPHYVELAPVPRRRPPPRVRPKLPLRPGGYATAAAARAAQVKKFREYQGKIRRREVPEEEPFLLGFARSQGWSRTTLWRVNKRWDIHFPPIAEDDDG